MSKKQWAIIGVLGLAVITILTCLGILVWALLARPFLPTIPEAVAPIQLPFGPSPAFPVNQPTTSSFPPSTPLSSPTNVPGTTLQTLWQTSIWNSAPMGASGLQSPILSPDGLEAEFISGKIYRTNTAYFILGNSIFLSGGDKFVRKLELNSGREQWKSEVQGSPMGLGKDILYVYREDNNRIYALSLDSGKERWRLTLASLMPAGAQIVPSAQVISYPGVVIIPYTFTGSYYNQPGMVILKEQSGEKVQMLEWEVPVTVKDGVLLTSVPKPLTPVGWKGRSPTDGRELWSFERTTQLLKADFKEGYLYVLASEGSQLSAIDMRTGKDRWGGGFVKKSGLTLTNMQLIGINQDYVVIASSVGNSANSEIFVIDRQSGSLQRRFPQERKYAAYLSDKNILIVSVPELTNSIGIDLKTNKKIWENDDLKLGMPPFDGAQGYQAFSADNFLLYFDSIERRALGLDALTGKIAWNLTETTMCYRVDACKMYDGKLYGSQANFVLALDPKSGKMTSFPGDVLEHVRDDLWLVQNYYYSTASGVSSATLSLMRLPQK